MGCVSCFSYMNSMILFSYCLISRLEMLLQHRLSTACCSTEAISLIMHQNFSRPPCCLSSGKLLTKVQFFYICTVMQLWLLLSVSYKAFKQPPMKGSQPCIYSSVKYTLHPFTRLSTCTFKCC